MPTPPAPTPTGSGSCTKTVRRMFDVLFVLCGLRRRLAGTICCVSCALSFVGAIERVRELLDGKGLRELGQWADVLLGVEGSAVQAGGRGLLRAQRADERVWELHD